MVHNVPYAFRRRFPVLSGSSWKRTGYLTPASHACSHRPQHAASPAAPFLGRILLHSSAIPAPAASSASVPGSGTGAGGCTALPPGTTVPNAARSLPTAKPIPLSIPPGLVTTNSPPVTNVPPE